MSQEFLPAELKNIAIQLDSLQGNLKQAQMNVIAFIESGAGLPTANCPRCASDLQIAPERDDDQTITILCPTCQSFGLLLE